MSKLSREQILKIIKLEIRDHEDCAANLREKALVLVTAEDLIEIGKALEETYIALSTIDDVMKSILKKESK